MDRPRRIGVGAGAAQDRRSRKRSSGEIQKVTADYIFHSGKLHRAGMMGKPPQPGDMPRCAARAARGYDYSCLMLAALITFAHFAVSPTIIFSKSAGLPTSGVVPS